MKTANTAKTYTTVALAAVLALGTALPAFSADTLTVFGMTRIVQGGEGDDVLLAVAGVDELTGGAGADRFVFRKASEIGVDEGTRDVITDFEAGTDIIDLRGVDAHAGRGGDQVFRLVDEFSGRAGQLTVEDLPAGPGGDGVLLCGDVDGDGIADFRIEVIGATDLGRADILL